MITKETTVKRSNANQPGRWEWSLWERRRIIASGTAGTRREALRVAGYMKSYVLQSRNCNFTL